MNTRSKILLIGDPTEFAGLDALLSKHQVDLCAASGEEALVLVRDTAMALVLLDVDAAGAEAFPLAERMRCAAPEVPLIFVAETPADDPRVLDGYALGAVDFFFKPVDPRRVEPKLALFLQLHRQRRALDARTAPGDVGDRKQAEDESARLEAVLDSLPVAVWIADRAGAVLRTNAAVDAVWGKAPLPDEVEGYGEYKGWWAETGERLAPQDWALARAVMKGEVSTGEVVDIERFDGVRATIINNAAPVRDSDGRIIGAVAVSQDITAKKRAEDALKQAEHGYRELIRRAPAPIYEIDFRAGRFLSVNDAVCALLGYTEEEMLALDPLALIDDAGRARFQPRLTSWMEGREPEKDVEYRVSTKDGRTLDVVLNSTFTCSEDGTPVSATVVAHDVTERRRAEETLRQAKDKLEESDRRKNEFMAVLSHELRNPLAPIKNSLYILHHAAAGGEQAHRAKQVIDRQVNHLTRLVDDLLDVTRVTRNRIVLQKEQLELNELVERAVEDQRSLFERSGLTLDLQLSREALFVDGDGARLVQVVSNLLQNAAKFTEAGGTVMCSVEPDGDGSSARLLVRDEGLGMEPATISHLFQPFMQAEATLDRSRGGLGLGLAVVKGLVELHGGTVSARSGGLGRGSEFAVCLPLLAKRAGAQSTPRPAASRRSVRVLIIEDNVDAADTLREALALGGHEVAVANDGVQGLAKAGAFQPEVVLCDIGLPGMNGFEVARAFRDDAALRGTCLVALTGYALPEDLERAAQAGFDHHFAKPPSLTKLEKLLGEIAQGRSGSPPPLRVVP